MPNRNLQAEYDRLKQQHEHKGLSPLPSPPEMMPTSPQSPRDAELIAEAKLLRQHKGRLEARMQILEDHNKQLESQLHRLRQLLEQPQAEAKVNGTTVSSPSTSLQRSDSSQPMLLRVVGSQTSESMGSSVRVEYREVKCLIQIDGTKRKGMSAFYGGGLGTMVRKIHKLDLVESKTNTFQRRLCLRGGLPVSRC
ncbi:hypothetical protein J1605_006517 [Eschrichtius robustus]|uniref:DMD n=1 Tax=Eschrichtius robustus TaxID=9764 RepID=A0AB34H058_ESCRO|nr:hypothetical protein J1605_006517 [Eschrichtius robustus]